MVKKGKAVENTNQKLGLAIKSGKHRVGKYTTCPPYTSNAFANTPVFSKLQASRPP